VKHSQGVERVQLPKACIANSQVLKDKLCLNNVLSIHVRLSIS
jgi:hypothetical protein